jgi:hypothetical protein
MSYVAAALLVIGALVAVAWPLLRRDPLDPAALDDTALERRITTYRAALRAGTVCDRCLRENPANAKFCLECGRAFRAPDRGSRIADRGEGASGVQGKAKE